MWIQISKWQRWKGYFLNPCCKYINNINLKSCHKRHKLKTESGRDSTNATQGAACRTRRRLGLPTLPLHPSLQPLYTHCFSSTEPRPRPYSTKCSGKLLCWVRNWVSRLAVSCAAWQVAWVQQSCKYTSSVVWRGHPSSQAVVNPIWPPNDAAFSPTPEKPVLLLDFGPRVKIQLCQNLNKNEGVRQFIVMWRQIRGRCSAPSSQDIWASKLENCWGGMNWL